MKFDKNHKVIFSSLTKEESVAFISFLEKEIERHGMALADALANTSNRGEAPFWDSAILRHNEDVSDIEVLIETVEHWFSLKGK
ncbi:hypothetical protein LCGC14_1735970 [marine sediment metagenome]|uniref:Uncharacterized protein n=1 Tax=marine sediment metagenome TaxID=412755 RepID=A0A0F9HVQ8_9ZZZZ